MAKADRPVYKCPCCDYCTHFPKALEAHQKFRKHFPAIGGKVKAEKSHIIGEEYPVEVTTEDETIVKDVCKEVHKAMKTKADVEKKVRRPRKKAAEE